jgi:hypothetical protein
VSWPVSRPTASITANVTTYCTSLTANDQRGGTKKKSKAPTLRHAASAAGPRPKRIATSTVPSRNSITMLARSSRSRSGAIARLMATLPATAHA